MTFSEVVAELENRFPEKPYLVSVELEQEANHAARCEHDPKVKRSLTWKITVPGAKKYETREFSGRTAEETLAQLAAPVPIPVPNLSNVDAHTVPVDAPKDDIPF